MSTVDAELWSVQCLVAVYYDRMGCVLGWCSVLIGWLVVGWVVCRGCHWSVSVGLLVVCVGSGVLEVVVLLWVSVALV